MNSWMDISFLGPLCALGSSATWAVGSAGYSRLSKTYSAFSVNFSRALVALPLFILTSFIVSGGFWEGVANYQTLRPSHWGWFTLSMIASYGLGDTLFLWSTRSLGVPGALAIGSCYPVWTVLAGFLFGDQTISGAQAAGLFITIMGVIVVVLNGPESERSDGRKKFSTTGILLALATSVAWATNSYATAMGGADLSAPIGNTVRMIMALILTASFGKFFAPQAALILPQRLMISSLWIFVLEAFGGSLFYMYGLSHSPLALGATLASLSPAISVPAAVFFRARKVFDV